MKRWRQSIGIVSAFIALFASTLPALASLCSMAQRLPMGVAHCAAGMSPETLTCCSGFTASHTHPSLEPGLETGSTACCLPGQLPSPISPLVVLSSAGLKVKTNEVKTNHAVGAFYFPGFTVLTPAQGALLPPAQSLALDNATRFVRLTQHLPGLSSGRAPPVG